MRFQRKDRSQTVYGRVRVPQTAPNGVVCEAMSEAKAAVETSESYICQESYRQKGELAQERGHMS